MNLEEFKQFQDCIMEHCHQAEAIANDRLSIEKHFKDHLSQFFSWDKIFFSENFDKITLKYAYGHGAVIHSDNLKDLHMDWIVSATTDDKAFRIIQVEIYPFGLKEVEWE